MMPPKATKTGTTIAGLVFKDGVVLAADTRATNGPIVADKNCEKIHYIAPNIYCCGAGTAADTEYTTALISSKLDLHRLNSGHRSRTITAVTMLKQHLFRHQGHIGAALILGGVDVDGTAGLYTIYPHGSVDRLPYVTMGSGSLAAMAVFEANYRPNLGKTEAMDLAAQAILAGIFNDLGSGSNVDLVVIPRSGGPAEIYRNHLTPNIRPPKEQSYRFASGTTPFLRQNLRPISDLAIVTTTTTRTLGSTTSMEIS